jgi:hypothetical protein
MTPIRSILLLAGVAASVSFAIFAGHALSTHETGPVAIGAGFLGAGIVLLTVYARTGRTT